MPSRTTWIFAGTILVAGATFASPRTAHAFEHQHHVGVGLGGSLLSLRDRDHPQWGPALSLHYTYGLSDTWNVMVETGFTIPSFGEFVYPRVTPNRPTHMAYGAAGFGYLIDVLRWVPYVGVLASGYAVGGGTVPAEHGIFGVQLAVGLDYAFTRHWSAGFAFRQHFLLSDFSNFPSLSTGVLRAEYTWGF
ncbi:MAG: outer membrane beta-barrel protein [Polyangiaceae bacterium]